MKYPPRPQKRLGLSAKTAGLNIKASYRTGPGAKGLTAHIVQEKNKAAANRTIPVDSPPLHFMISSASQSIHNILAALEHDFLILYNKPVLYNRIDIVFDMLVILRYHIIPLPIRLQCHKFRMGLFITSANAIFMKDFSAPSFRKK